MAADSFNDLSKEDVLGWFDKREIAKAGPYVDLVRDIEIEPMIIRAIVPGTAPMPYAVVVRLMEARGGALLISASALASFPGWRICAAFRWLSPRKKRGRPVRVSNFSTF